MYFCPCLCLCQKRTEAITKLLVKPSMWQTRILVSHCRALGDHGDRRNSFRIIQHIHHDKIQIKYQVFQYTSPTAFVRTVFKTLPSSPTILSSQPVKITVPTITGSFVMHDIIDSKYKKALSLLLSFVLPGQNIA